MFESKKELRSELKGTNTIMSVFVKIRAISFEGVSTFQMEKYQLEIENKELKIENEILRDRLSRIIDDKLVSLSLKETSEKGVYESVVKLRLKTE